MSSHRRLSLAVAVALAAASTAALPATDVAASDAGVPPSRDAEPVVLLGAQLPSWSAPPADGQPAPWPSGTEAGDSVRSAHNGTLVSSGQEGAPTDHIVAYRWDAHAEDWTEVPVQVDERFPYFLANARSDFGLYSGTDTELTYAWNPTANSVGEEAWKKVAGECEARYPTPDELPDLVAEGVITPGAGEMAEDYTGPMPDPVPGLDHDDELVFLATDAGDVAPLDAAPPTSTATDRHEVLVTDPLDPTTVRAVYLFLDERGPAFDHETGHVHLERSDDADVWHDRASWAADDPEKLGSSNTGYGPNLPGTVCDDPFDTDDDGDRQVRTSETRDRFPLDTTTVRTAAYEWHASGRWMIRDMRVAAPTQNPAAERNAVPGTSHGEARFAARKYGPDLVDRWKGRAFQQSPDSSISLVGFEDEQVNWEANSALLGWKVGPVRAIREIWGADSGTNVTKVETLYRDLVQYRYYVRVHPIPPDGLYTSWDYNAGVATTYFNTLRPDGVAIDGENDDVGQVDEVAGNPAFFDAPDPTFDLPSAMYRWEQVAGEGEAGSLVYSFDMTGATTTTNALVVPYYRDDACLDDGTGDDPVPRPWPGERSTDERVQQGYADHWGQPYEELTCEQKQGAYGAHGLHFFLTQDSDNAFVGTSKPVNEIDGRQWQFAVPMEDPRNVGEAYGNVVRAPLTAVVTPQP